MTRQKVKLVWIKNDSARKASFKKRRVGFMKKVRELTTLCGIQAFAVVYGPDDQIPIIWPSLPAAQHLYRRFHSLPLVERKKKMANQETFLKDRMVKAQDLFKKVIMKNEQLEIDILMHQLHAGRPIREFSNVDLLALMWMMQHKMRECRKRIEFHQQVNRLPRVPGFVSSNSTLLQITGGNETAPVDNGTSLVDQWFMDMVMDEDDQIGGATAAPGELELGFVPHQGNGFINGGINPMMEMGGTLTPQADNLLSQWNFEGTGYGVSEIEKFLSPTNGAIDENAYPVDLMHHQWPYGNHIGLYPDCDRDRVGDFNATDSEMMMLNELFGNESNNQKLNGNEDDFLNKEWENYITPP